MIALGSLFDLAGIILKYVTLSRQLRAMAADMADGMTWLAAWRKYGWYRSEDIAWLLLLTVGVVLIWRAYFAS